MAPANIPSGGKDACPRPLPQPARPHQSNARCAPYRRAFGPPPGSGWPVARATGAGRGAQGPAKRRLEGDRRPVPRRSEGGGRGQEGRDDSRGRGDQRTRRSRQRSRGRGRGARADDPESLRCHRSRGFRRSRQPGRAELGRATGLRLRTQSSLGSRPGPGHRGLRTCGQGGFEPLCGSPRRRRRPRKSIDLIHARPPHPAARLHRGPAALSRQFRVTSRHRTAPEVRR